MIQPLGPEAAAYYFQGQKPGVWLGKGAAALQLGGDVQRRALTAVLRGCDPSGGGFLPAHKPARRRAGWDLILAAPKSVSLLAAPGRPEADALAGAHRAAVAGVVSHFEEELLRVLREGTLVPGRGLVAASFGHFSNAAGEPHLHSHLVVANLAQGPEGQWSHLASGGWWPSRQELGTVYRLALRHEVARAGFEVSWRVREDGLADVAGVPRAAIRQASSRGRAAAAEAALHDVSGARRRSGIRRGATSTTRPGPEPAGQVPPFRDPLPAGGVTPRAETPDLESAVASRLLLERSNFRRSDVYGALGACCAEGMAPTDAARWVDRFCDRSVAVPPRAPTHAPRWTTAKARSADARLEAALAGAGVLGAPLGCSHLLAHAAYLEAAAAGWAEDGSRVRLVTDSPQGQLRWRVLTGITGGAGGRPDVLLVDHADRRSTPDLLGIVSGARKVVLIEGGTLARLTWVRSAGLERYGDSAGRLPPGPEPAWSPELTGGRSAQAAGRLLGAFAAAWGSPEAAVLVGLGPAETDGLNRAARAYLVQRGDVGGPSVEHRGRTLQAADRVVALRRVAPGIAPGAILTIAGVDPARGSVEVTGPSGRGRVEHLDRGAATHLGYGYALTPALAARVDAPLLVLGPPDAVGRHRHRVRAAEMALGPLGRGPALTR